MINVTEEQLVAAFESWYSNYMDDPESYPEYDSYNNSTSYAIEAAKSLVAHINKIKGE